MIRKIHSIAAAFFLMQGTLAAADDIEIYLNGDTAGGTPYLHLMLDYRPSVFNALCNYAACEDMMSAAAFANLTDMGFVDGDQVSTFTGFVAVVETVIENPKFDPIHMALIAPNKNDGGTILKGYTHLETGRAELIDVLTSIQEATVGADAHKLSPKETHLEWFRYLNGGRVVNGTLTQGNFTDGPAAADSPTPNYDASIIGGGGPYGTYISPFDDADECPKLYSVLMGMNTENQDDDWNDEIEADMSALAAQRKFENMMSWLHRGDTDLISGVNTTVPLQKSWVISDSGSVGQTPDWAAAGGSGAVLNLEDPKALEEELVNAFTEIISVSSTFVAASVPVNVFNQSKSLDNLFVALFQAKATLHWPGNLKKLKLADTFDLNDPNDPAARDGVFDDILDVNGNPGFESTGDNKGRITFDAVTFWTDVDTLPAADGETVPVNADGREVARGGGGQKIDGFVDYDGNDYFIGDTNSDDEVNDYPPRQVFVEPDALVNGNRNSFTAFNATDAMAVSLKTLLDPNDPDITDDEALDLIKWGRGQDVANNSAEARTWILADAIHSRPFALNYGTAGGYSADNPNIRLFIGTGDGLFHIIENTDTDGNETGREVFAFYPREMLKNIKLRMDDSISALKMQYGVDGEPVVYTLDKNKDGTIDHTDDDKAYVFFGLRRGGNSYYALDVSDPDDTRLLWKISQTTGGDFDELGMTFSTPVVGSVRYDGVDEDVLVFAGGYSGGWNADYTARIGKDLNDDDDSIGNAIYIVNAHTGDLIWKAVEGDTGDASNTSYEHAGLVDSIPSKVTVLENNNGNIHRIYVGDTGGAVWRVDLPEGDGSSDSHRQDSWFVTKLAELGTDGANSDRRFFHAPDIVETYDDSGSFDGLVIESGDRADPNETSVENYLFYIKDRKIVTGDATVKAENDVADPPGRIVFDSAQANGLLNQTDCVTGAEDGCDVFPLNGWKLELERAGEKGLSSPLVDAGRVFFSTFRPGSAGTCEPSEGQGSIGLVNLADGTAVANDQRFYDIGPGIPPGAILIGDVILLPGGGAAIYDLDGDGNLDNSNTPPSLSKTMYQIYWREPGIDKL